MEIEKAIIPLHSSPVRPIKPWHVIGVLTLLVSAVSIHVWALASVGLLNVHVLSIGQGDAILVTTPDGKQVLIDGGPDGTILSKLGSHIPSWDRNLDVVIATHKDSDHITGLVAVLERYDVERVIHGSERKTSAISRAWDAAVEQEGAVVTEGIAGTTISLGASISMTVLFPYESRNGALTKHANDDSVVIMLQHERVQILLTGDAEQATERRLVADGVVLDADVLKAGHHGSKTSTTPEFLAAVTPQAVIVSAGAENRYGHPHQVVLTRLAEFGIPYYRTDTQGDVTVTSDGRSFSIRTQK